MNYFELRWTAGLFWKYLGSLLKDGRVVSDGVDVASTCAHVAGHGWFTLVDQWWTGLRGPMGRVHRSTMDRIPRVWLILIWTVDRRSGDADQTGKRVSLERRCAWRRHG